MKFEDKGGARLKKLLADPERAERVAAIRDGMREMDRAYVMNLALIRSAAAMTQKELAEILGVGQAAVSKVERQHDLLLSTLASYLRAAGAHARIVVTVGDQNIEYDLSSFHEPAESVSDLLAELESSVKRRRAEADRGAAKKAKKAAAKKVAPV